MRARRTAASTRREREGKQAAIGRQLPERFAHPRLRLFIGFSASLSATLTALTPRARGSVFILELRVVCPADSSHEVF